MTKTNKIWKKTQIENIKKWNKSIERGDAGLASRLCKRRNGRRRKRSNQSNKREHFFWKVKKWNKSIRKSRNGRRRKEAIIGTRGGKLEKENTNWKDKKWNKSKERERMGGKEKGRSNQWDKRKEVRKKSWKDKKWNDPIIREGIGGQQKRKEQSVGQEEGGVVGAIDEGRRPTPCQTLFFFFFFLFLLVLCMRRISLHFLSLLTTMLICSLIALVFLHFIIFSKCLRAFVFSFKWFSILSHLPGAWERNELLKHQHPTTLKHNNPK